MYFKSHYVMTIKNQYIYILGYTPNPMQREIIIKMEKNIKPSGHGYHVFVPKEFGKLKTAEVRIKQMILICDSCHGTFKDKKNFSKDPRYCKKCLAAKEFLKDNPGLKCRGCKKKLSQQEYIAAGNDNQCEKCWIQKEEGLK